MSDDAQREWGHIQLEENNSFFYIEKGFNQVTVSYSNNIGDALFERNKLVAMSAADDSVQFCAQ